MGIVYGLCDPDTRELRYVGKTIVPLHRRLTQHLTCARRGDKTYCYRWMKSLLDKNKEPEIFEIETTDDDGSEAEIHLIAYFKSLGCKLTNLSPGGGLGRTGLKNGPKQREATSKASRGRVVSAETRAKMAAAMKARNISPEERTRLYKLGLGKYIASDENRKRVSALFKGTKLSAEHREKLAASKRGKPRSPEARANMRAARLAFLARKAAEKLNNGA